MAFQVWLQFAGESARDGNSIVPQRPPEQLPVVLQVLLSQVSYIFIDAILLMVLVMVVVVVAFLVAVGGGGRGGGVSVCCCCC